jgi:NCAIR mutase (PurE)-related protein
MRKILEQVKAGKLSIKDAERSLKEHFLEVYKVAQFDLTREHRTGVPEVVIAEDKSIEQILKIVSKTHDTLGRVIITRLTPERAIELKSEFIKSGLDKECNMIYHEEGKICILRNQKFKIEQNNGKVGIITAGTSDIPVAEEAKVLVEELGCSAYTAYDLGVSGAHRVIPPLKEMIQNDVDVLIVLAGREGALPTLVAGLVDIPVIGVPISTGYGLKGKGKTALYAMLQSCSPFVVVNIDAGFVAAAVAVQIAKRVAKARDE